MAFHAGTMHGRKRREGGPTVQRSGSRKAEPLHRRHRATLALQHLVGRKHPPGLLTCKTRTVCMPASRASGRFVSRGARNPRAARRPSRLAVCLSCLRHAADRLDRAKRGHYDGRATQLAAQHSPQGKQNLALFLLVCLSCTMRTIALRGTPAPMLCARWASLPAWGARLAASAARQHILDPRAVHVLAAQQQSEAAAAAPPPPPERRQQPEQQTLSVVAATPTATQLLAAFFACELHPADCYLLHGSVGAGKSYFRCGAAGVMR